MSSLRRKVAAGEIIRPWLILGPFYQDLRSTVVGAAADYRGSTATHGCGAMAKVIADAADILGSTPREAQEAEFRALRGRWQLVRQPAPYFSWGRYFYTNHVTAAFLSTLVTAEDPGTRRWRLLTHVTGRPSRVVISLNQELIYDSGAHSAGAALEQGEHHFRAVLRPGENVLNVGMFRIANFAQAGCRLEVTDGDMEAWIPLAQSMPLASRLRMETELSSVRLPRDLLYPEHEVIVYLGLAPASPVRVRLLSSAGEALREVMASEPGPASLGPAGELADGPYQIECAWLDSAGAPVTSVAHSVEKVTLAPHLPGEKHQEERRRIALTCATSAGRTIGSNQRPNIWAQVAYYAEGRYDRIDERTIRDTCAFIAERRDCSEFVLAGLLRLMYFDQAERRLSPEIRALMKDTVLGFKYWLDEPGDTLMCMITENHAFRFHVDEWLAGQLFPDEEFANSHQRGLFHILKGRTYLTEWLRRKGRFGLSEWHSNHYLPTNFPSLVNVFDFARKGEDDLREMARAVLDYLCFILATDTFEGVFGTPHFRCYGRDLKHPEVEGTSPTCWLLYGTGSLVEGIIDDAVVALATSRYRPPGILSLMAADRQAVVHSRIRQALGVPWSDEVSAYYCVYRTPDYMIAGLQDFRKGGFGAGIHVAQVTLPGKAVIFWSCPHTSEEGPGLRPDYWSGNASMPRVIQERNVMSLTFRLLPETYTWMSHCFFDRERFDEVRLEGQWAFARVERGYVGIHSQNDMVVGDWGQYAGRELVCYAPENTWLVECGRESDWGSFDTFVSALRSAPIVVQDGVIIYESPSIGRFVTGWDVVPTINGQPVQLRDYPLVDSPWAHADFGSGRITLRYADQQHEIWQNV